MPEIIVHRADPADAGEILTLQRAAFVAEGAIYGEFDLPPLTETYEGVLAAVEAGAVVTAVAGHRIVGAGRAVLDADGVTLHIARLAVAPDQQGRGIGTRVLARLEADAPPAVRRFALAAGSRSEANIRLYERNGYVRTHVERIRPLVEIVHLIKDR